MTVADLGEAEFLYGLQALLPRGLAWPRDPDAALTQLLAGLAATQARQHARTGDLSERESDPAQALELLGEWEASYGLPDPCLPLNATIEQRRAALLARIVARGGQSRAYFIEVAAALGYDITIEEFRPFRFGAGRFGGRIYGLPWAQTWRAYAAGAAPVPFRFGRSAFGEPLRVWGNGPVECVLRRLKPARTQLLFATYQADWDLTGGLPSGATLARPSGATRRDARGRLAEVVADAERYDYDTAPAYNQVPNPWADGSGAPTLPDGWAVAAGSGITPVYLSSGVRDGIPYTRWRLQGTSSGGGFPTIHFQPFNSAPAPTGTDIAGTIHFEIARLGGTHSLVDFRHRCAGVNAGGTVTGNYSTTITDAATRTFGTGPVTQSRNMVAADIVFARAGIMSGNAAGRVFDIDFDIGFPTMRVGSLTPLTDVAPVQTLAARSGSVAQYGLRGLLVEPAGSNAVRNPRLEGGATGTPGTPPTGMLMTGTTAGLSRQILAFGVEDDLPCMDVRFSGTTTAAVGIEVYWTTIGQAMPAVLGDVVTASFRWRLLAGTWPAATFAGLRAWHYDAGGVATTAVSQAAVPTGAVLRSQPVRLTWTVADALAASASHRTVISLPAGITVDFTLRLGGPQLQPGTGRSDILPPVGVPGVSTAADDVLVLLVPDGSYDITATAGTLNAGGTDYIGTGQAVLGQGLRFPWPAAAIAARERHLRHIHLRKV